MSTSSLSAPWPTRTIYHIAQVLLFCQQHPVVSKALTCLETSWKTLEQGGKGSFVYTKALLAYAFALAGSQDKRNEILKSLDNEAIKEGKGACYHVHFHPIPVEGNRSIWSVEIVLQFSSVSMAHRGFSLD